MAATENNKLSIKFDESAIIVPQPVQRFTLDEWHLDHRYQIRCSETQQQLADRLLADSDRVQKMSIELAKNNKEEVDYRLKEKLKDIEFCKKELLQSRKQVLLEIDALGVYKERLLGGLASVRQNAMVICQKCLIAREHRLGIDLVRDKVERELHKEIEVIKCAEKLLVRILEQTQEQIRKLKAALYFMDHDIEDKENNLRIDHHNLTLKETSLNMNLCHGNASLTPATITLSEWEAQTNNNITAALKEINSARPIRCYIDTVLKQINNDLDVQKQATDEAFRKRIEETSEAKAKLELQHSEIMRQANEMTTNIARLEVAIRDNERYAALAHTRLGNRCQRPGLELTQDLVESSLVKEVHDLRRNVMTLRKSLNEAEASLRYLLKTQIQLEEDISVKSNTLKIDEVECMTLRQRIDYHAY